MKLQVAETEAGPIRAIADDRLLVNPGLWLVHRIAFNITVRQYKLLWMCMVRLRMINLDPDFSTPTEHVPVQAMPGAEFVDRCLQCLPFDKRYLIEALLSHGTITIPEVDELLRALAHYQRDDDQIVILEGLFKWTRQASIEKDLQDVARRATRLHISDTGRHLTAVRRCLVTPTRCVLNPPTWETSNEMLRDHEHYVDRFLRVQFVDDDGDFPVVGETLVIDDEMQGREGVFARVRRALSDGLVIAGRHYVFATFSESQAKERGCWMIAEDGPFTVSAVLAKMGDLSQERIIAKHAARQRGSMPKKITINRALDDIKRNSYVFTDGVGHFSHSLAQACAKTLGYRLIPVSAAQIRIGGAKGVLAVVQDETLGENEVRLRPSMIKLQGVKPEPTLNIIKVATYSKATLNRQAILLMEDRGVSSDTLFDIFTQEKRRIQGLESGFDPMRLASVTTFPLARALRHDIKDPVVQNVTSLVKCRLLCDLKWKAWIELSESAYLMGIADETDSLQEGEIFCQIHPSGSDPQVIEARCTIYRNPCLHPGDVRLVTAVDCPKLRHLRNVIVFSTRGCRDLPNMLAGGDLDGDCYSLIWDPRLLIPEGGEYEPMDYTPPPAVRSEYPVTIEQTKQHFLDTMKNDVLGRVCNAHMALADLHGPSDFQCRELASLASQAVDFSKTGVAVQQSEIPRLEEYPDFMGKEYKSIRIFKKQEIRSYSSEKVLGRMFREIDPEPIFEEAVELAGDPRLLEAGEETGFREYLQEAAMHKARYEFELTGLLRRYNINETECVAGLLLRSPKTRLKVEKDYDLRVAVRDAYSHIIAATIARADGYIKEHPVSEDSTQYRLAWAIAAYKLTYDQEYSTYLKIDWGKVDEAIWGGGYDETLDEFEEVESSERRLSFPWVSADSLFMLLC
ncbi:uncharacterized protein PHACADRAFT_201955 [Phanerochaete carnosa HHB-10118-sp]|uniref:RNA-dependent RNA polymerase n=1 Tax=Phanerochaete carnosa (strain HHB-10118-sp) TaxID=650164 RepID=K5VDE8_PHACS|nr:uncharacterized protein PHACADRAFT_201955 [Phanerochaete carnosa HHB-10118-sp]EKM49158.1 hypothetical protein PHACADRAFT_201955 [Phanerochaete carnosa HHB-10118-sp]